MKSSRRQPPPVVPPRLAREALSRLLPEEYRDAVLGDLAEGFEDRRARSRFGILADLWYWRQVLHPDVLRLRREARLERGPRRQGDGTMRRSVFELGQAARRLRRAPGYVAAFVLTLGLAIGVNSAVFSVVNGVLLRPLPFPDADRILFIKHASSTRAVQNAFFSFMELDDYREAVTTFDELVEFRDWEFTLLIDSEPHRTVGAMITSNYFDVLQLRPGLGRILSAQDDVEGSEGVMVLTDEYWDRMFGRDPGVLGKVVHLENLTAAAPYTPVRVVGVLEPGLHYSSFRRPDFYVNYSANGHYSDASMRDSRTHRMTEIFARMAPGVTVDAARAELEAITDEVHRRYPDVYRPEYGLHLDVVPWKDELTRNGRATFLFLMGTVGLVLLLAAANVANLTLTRLIRKEGELGTRTALGASTTDLRIQLTAEHVLLGTAGGALGVLLAYVSSDALAAYAARFTIRAQEVGVDWTVLAVTLGGAVLVATILAWLPGLPINPGVGRMSAVGSRTTGGRARRRAQRGLVVGQLALSFTLLTGAGLLIRSLSELTSVDPGFATEEIVTMRAPTGPRGLPMSDSQDPGWAQVLEEVRAFPGVRSAAVATWAPLTAAPDELYAYGVRTDEGVDEVDRSRTMAANNVSPEYFELLGIPLLSGRFFVEADREGATDVVILNRSMARAYFGNEDPVGRRMWIGGGHFRVYGSRWYEIVGVVADTRELGMDVADHHTFYLPAAQSKWGPTIVVAHRGDATGLAQHVRDAVHRVQPNRAVEDIQTLTSLVERDLAPSRLNTMLFGSFAALALLIAALGVLGTLAFSVSQRVREFGIRMAIGAHRASVLRNVLGEGVALVAIALALGVGASLLLGRFLAGLIYGVGPVDVPSMVMAGSVLATVALGAALMPAVRATRIHPTEALRGE